MKRYWLRIAGGALGIFTLGMIVIAASRHGLDRAKALIGRVSSFDVPAAVIPFKLDGQTLGSIRRIQLDRAGPDQIDGVHLVVRLDDPSSAATLSTCTLSARGLRDINDRTTFLCHASGDAGAELVHFGDVVFEPGDLTLELQLPQSEVAEWGAGEPSAPTGPAVAAVVENAVNQAMVNLRAGGGRALLQVRDENGRDLVQLNADSGGAFLRIRDGQGREVLKMRADSGGLVFHVKDDSGKVVDFRAGNR